MALLIGIDEAGYGPNLGPLTICGTSWAVGDPDVDLYHALQEVVNRELATNGKMTICDSKSIFRSADSLRNLETSVLAILFAKCGSVPGSLEQLQTMLACSLDFFPAEEFASVGNGMTIPVASSEEMVKRLGGQFRRECDRQGVGLAEVKCRAIFPRRFNELVLRHGNKANLLSAATLKIAAGLRRSGFGPVRIVCDKHGGRSRYAALVSHFLTDSFVTTQCESRQISRYCWPDTGVDGNVSQVEIAFQARGETFLPTAASSMIAKYVRELSMIVWNRFWQFHVPGIKPTQGYPADAKRFHAAIAAEQMQLGIPDASIWRSR